MKMFKKTCKKEVQEQGKREREMRSEKQLKTMKDFVKHIRVVLDSGIEPSLPQSD